MTQAETPPVRRPSTKYDVTPPVDLTSHFTVTPSTAQSTLTHATHAHQCAVSYVTCHFNAGLLLIQVIRNNVEMCVYTLYLITTYFF